MLYKYSKRTRDFYCYFSLVSLYFTGVFNKTIIPLALVGYEMSIANSAHSALRASSAIYHLISNAGSWNNCFKSVQPRSHFVFVVALFCSALFCFLCFTLLCFFVSFLFYFFWVVLCVFCYM